MKGRVMHVALLMTVLGKLKVLRDENIVRRILNV
jgi:hypothetical protein